MLRDIKAAYALNACPCTRGAANGLGQSNQTRATIEVSPEGQAVDLTVDENVLTVRAERPAETTEGVEVLVSERPQGTYVRRIFLGEAIDADKLSARCDNGVLTVVAPVSESAKPRKVEIAASNGTPALEAKTSRA